MPKALPYACTTPGCRHMQPCPVHSFKREDRGFYDTKLWRALSRQQLRLFPWCRPCINAGRGLVKASVADHRIPRRAGGSDTLKNLESLCRRCHAHKRQSERLAIRQSGSRLK